jgi:hypothetical protein
MERIDEFVDERQKPWCIHCGDFISDVRTNRDHVPTKAFLCKPYPKELPIVTICMKCNNGFSKDEEYTVAFLGAVISGSTESGSQHHPSAARILQHHDKLRERIERSKQEVMGANGQPQLNWSPELDRIKRILIKNARGHAFYEYGEPMLDDPSHVHMVPISAFDADAQSQFEIIPSDGVWPEVGSRMMTRMMTGQDLDGSWVVVQEGVYRYGVTQCNGGILVRTVIMDYLGTQVFWGEED